MSPGTVHYFVTGQAPYRKFVADFSNTFPQTRISNGYFHCSGIFGGKIVLEEATDTVILGLSANTLTETTWIQDLQYPGQVYQLDQGSALRRGAPLYARRHPGRGHPGPRRRATSSLAGTDLATGYGGGCHPGAGHRPGLDAGNDRDAFGNTVPSYYAVRYDLVTDTISQRRNEHGNVIGDSALVGLPWENPDMRQLPARGQARQRPALCGRLAIQRQPLNGREHSQRGAGRNRFPR